VEKKSVDKNDILPGQTGLYGFTSRIIMAPFYSFHEFLLDFQRISRLVKQFIRFGGIDVLEQLGTTRKNTFAGYFEDGFGNIECQNVHI